jgi:tripartite ATP-independent transporter DctP family solute receptor
MSLRAAAREQLLARFLLDESHPSREVCDLVDNSVDSTIGGETKMSRKIDIRAGKNATLSCRSLTRRNALKGGLALGAGLTVGAFGIIGRASAAPITMRFGSDSPIGAPHTKSALVMKELIESRTSGRVQVIVFPDAQLGANGAMTNSIKAGTLDAVVTAVSILSPAVPEIDVFSLPFLYQDAVEALRVANGPFGAKLAPKVNEAFDCEVVGYTTDGVTELYTKARPVKKPEDIAGLKVGCSTSRIQRDTILALGGIPTVMDITANYTALQTGLINASTKSRPDVIELKLYQVTKYLTLANLYSMPNLLVVSKKFLSKLTPQDQEVVRAAGLPACEAQKEAVLASQGIALDYLTGHGIQTVEVENLQAFRDRVSGVYKETGDRIGPALVAEARNLAST